jgi:hypothetical protein
MGAYHPFLLPNVNQPKALDARNFYHNHPMNRITKQLVGDIGVGNGQGSMTFGGIVMWRGGGFENTGLISVASVYFRTFPFWLLVTGPSRYDEMLFTRS